MSTAYAKDDEQDVDINDPIVMDSLADQETSDVMEPARKVRFEIKEAKVRTQRLDSKAPASDDNPWIFKRLSLQVAVGADGTDGEGANHNRRLFPEYLIAFNRGAEQSQYDFESDWYKKRARGPAKELFAALGFDPAAPPPVDQEFLAELVGREFVADITRKSIDKKTDEVNEKGKAVYKPTGDFRNELANHRAV